ncbi:hypothetical protein SODALDRAFT_360090 [Sodiomyces alkalinus F11]|uniref:Uncharacterized protein n=1 Tax=Sodiomyces alkalinus (strain CBS 110278 / VKM F-3762 / F11) TaxID=1314773 RepID=A0A3N2PTH9_SODAK|nr:hypothetical protein SODALDRAFT_360090 [Sodiomyces alkalinus F11]ROT37798.1 hypothetical protein SODALDRAFT_360090 [Sodiomyces alkalinus F11]
MPYLVRAYRVNIVLDTVYMSLVPRLTYQYFQLNNCIYFFLPFAHICSIRWYLRVIMIIPAAPFH